MNLNIRSDSNGSLWQRIKGLFSRDSSDGSE